MPSRCQYVSGLFLQCNNLLAEPTPSTSGAFKPTSTSGGDAANAFCDKHAPFIEAVKCHANISKRALDPDFKGPPDLLLDDEPANPNRSAGGASHVFEPCCSDAWTHNEENPLRNAGVLTDKEITRQQEAAVTRMLDRVNDLRSMLRIRFVEHLKQKPAVLEERKKLKLSAKNETERARLLRLKGDMSYAPYNKHVSVFLDKCRRKHQAEAEGQRGHINPDTWLEDAAAHKDGEQRCTFVHEQPIAPLVNSYLYQSPTTDDVEAILRSVCDAVVKREDAVRDAHRCRGRRVPMTEFCAEHFNRDAEATLFGPCTVCKEPSLSVDGQLCRKHARPLYTKPPPEPLVVPALHPRSGTPVHADRVAASRPPLGAQRPPTNGAWKVNGHRTLPPIQLSNGLASPVAANGADSRGGNLAAFRNLPTITRKPRDPLRFLADEERLSNEDFVVNQNAARKFAGDGITSVKIDDDLPEDEFAEVCKKRRCLDEYEEIPLDKQPVADPPPQTLRVNGYNGGGISPMAVISVPHSLSDSIVFNQTSKASGRPAALGACARVRPFVGSKELKNQPAAVILNTMKPAMPQMRDRIITTPIAGRMIRIRENRIGSFARPQQFGSAALFAHHQPPNLRIAATTTAKPPPQLVADTRKTTHLH